MLEKSEQNQWSSKVEGEVIPEADIELELEPLPDGLYDVEPRGEATGVSDEIKVEAVVDEEQYQNFAEAERKSFHVMKMK